MHLICIARLVGGWRVCGGVLFYFLNRPVRRAEIRIPNVLFVATIFHRRI